MKFLLYDLLKFVSYKNFNKCSLHNATKYAVTVKVSIYIRIRDDWKNIVSLLANAYTYTYMLSMDR